MPFSFSLVALQHVSNLLFDFLLFNTRVIIAQFPSLRINLSTDPFLALSFPSLSLFPTTTGRHRYSTALYGIRPILAPTSALRPDTALTGAQTGRPLLVTGEVYHGLSNVIHVWQFLIQ